MGRWTTAENIWKYNMNTEPFTILVVDDLKTTRRMFVQELGREKSFRILEASNGNECLEIFTAERPDLVLLDIDMPIMDGYQVAKKIRELDAGSWTPIIFLSGLSRDLDILKGIEAGGDDYLIKPVRSAILFAKIRVMQRLLDAQTRLEDLTKELNSANEKLNQAVEIDGLTQLVNRRGLDRMLYAAIDAAKIDQEPLTIVLMDIDHFKLYNDHYGHVDGDACLKKFSQILKELCIHDYYVAARYGGEEFALIMPKTSRTGAMTFARALMHTIARKNILHEASPVKPYLTISGGITTVVPNEETTAEGLLRRADEALYTAKSQGRNRFFSYELQLNTIDQSPSVKAGGRAN